MCAPPPPPKHDSYSELICHNSHLYGLKNEQTHFYTRELILSISSILYKITLIYGKGHTIASSWFVIEDRTQSAAARVHY